MNFDNHLEHDARIEAVRVTASVLVRRDADFLILKRSDDEKFLPGYFDLPGGKVELGEDPWVAARREVLEETGIDVKLLAIHDVWHYYSQYNQVATQFVQLEFVGQYVGGQSRTTDAGVSQWIEEKQIAKLKPITKPIRFEIESGLAWFQNRSRTRE